MKGFIKLFILYVLFVPLLSFAQSDLKSTSIISIIESKNSAYYRKTSQELNRIFKQIHYYQIKDSIDNDEISKSRIIITYGLQAAVYARKHFPNKIKILSYLTEDQSLSLKLAENETHLLIEHSPQLYIQFSKAILPKQKIGVLYQKAKPNLLEAFDKFSIALETKQIIDSKHTLRDLRKVLQSSDLLLAIPNKNIYNRHSLKGLLLTTYQNKKALISYSKSHVKAGAIAAIYATPNTIAKDIINQINKLVVDHKSQRYFSQEYEFSINHRVARSLEIKFDNKERILKRLKRLTKNETN